MAGFQVSTEALEADRKNFAHPDVLSQTVR